MTAAKMSPKTAEILFGHREVALGELMGLTRRILAALDATSEYPDERYGACRRLAAVTFEAPAEPALDWEMPLPEWPAMDFSVPRV